MSEVYTRRLSEVYQAIVGKTSDERTGAADMMHETYRLEKFIRRKRSSDENSMGKTQNETVYDENALKLLKQKIVLAYILSYTVKEFYTMDIDSIARCIEGEPEIHKTAVDELGQDISDFVTPMISGKDPNRKSRQEGNVLFDILFDVLVPDRNETIKLIINIEAQNEIQNLKYDIVTRGIYYVARSISAQKNIEFVNSNYQDIKKVYSIWICINCNSDVENTITEYSIDKKELVGHYAREDYYDLLSVIQICLSKDVVDAADDSERLLRLLETFFSSNMSIEERKDIIVNDFSIPYSNDIERSVDAMCNASQGIKNEAMRQGVEKGKIEGKIEAYMDMGLTADDISRKMGISKDTVCDIINSLTVTV